MPKIDTVALYVIAGRPYPMGTAVYDEGVRFTVFSRNATRVWLALFENVDSVAPLWEYELDPNRHRTGDVWSIFVGGLRAGAYYMYRMDGPFQPELGHRFAPETYLLDPYAKAFVGNIHDGTMKCVTVHDDMDWADDRPLRIPMKDTIIYETHVRGFTKHASSGVRAPGTYQGLIEKIPYLMELGITAVELLPVQEFGENLLGRCSLFSGEELVNYWGYSNIGFFAPSGRYACSAVSLEHLEEFRRMVLALHYAGIEVILDVVFNHTSEGDERGPTLCFRGIDNAIYYFLDSEGNYLNYSGCGNTLNCDHPVVRDFILDCLRYWVAVMHIDGFRFDLASILGRDEKGDVLADAPLIERIAEDPVLRHVKLIAEAWDASGAYQVGSFGGLRWAEWNGQYRDDVRRFWRGDPRTHGKFASRLAGSADIYQWAGRTPVHSINFVTCHDGFTLRDLVSYNQKHNEANGDANQDGSDANYSLNCGVEGDTDDPEILALRLRMQKNFLATMFLSLGVPMLLAGDEFGRTQRGNNNAYCQDNEISWCDWRMLKKNHELHHFCKELISFRKENPAFTRSEFFVGKPCRGPESAPDLGWHSGHGGPVDWTGSDSALACRIDGEMNGGAALYLMFNNADTPRRFLVPRGRWLVRINTGQPPPGDIHWAHEAPPINTETMELAPRSMVVLAAAQKPKKSGKPAH